MALFTGLQLLADLIFEAGHRFRDNLLESTLQLFWGNLLQQVTTICSRHITGPSWVQCSDDIRKGLNQECLMTSGVSVGVCIVGVRDDECMRGMMSACEG